ncbi:Ig-like domain repeat protein, partial [uncultured Methanobrevibacter sp.]|uniref:Ig-like domain repeat protein n=1 Tax=uncultured Methanobrevibacter sp. TaxID=253161 RepID=UPI00260371F6
NSDATGLVKFKVTGTEEYLVYADVIDGKAILVDILDTGDYTVIATYMGDDKYNTNVTSESFTIKGHTKQNTTIDANVKINGYTAEINVNVNPNATGFIELTTKDSTIYLALENGATSVNNTLHAGSYNFAIRYIGDDNYNENSTSLEFVIIDPVKENTDIDLNVVIDENDVVYIVDVDSDATGIAKFEVTGTEEYTVYADVINGKAILEDILVAGDYTVIATYMGDARFNTNITTQSFTVKGHEKQNTAIDADANINGYRTTITVNVNPNATGFVRVKLADTIANIELTNGAGSLITTLAAGSYYVDLTYLGDDNFNQNATKVTFTVVDPVKESTPISIDIGGFETNVTFTANVDNRATGLVKYEVIGPEHYLLYVDVEDGVGYLYDILVPGDYTVYATYMGDGRFNSNITSEKFTVAGHIKKDTPISAGADVNGYRVTIDVNVDATATGFVKVKLGDTIFNVELIDGAGSVTTNLVAGSYYADLTYLGDDNFNQNSTIVTFTVVDPVKESTPISIDIGVDENNVTFYANVDNRATGIVKYEVTGPEHYVLYVDVIDGVAYLYDILVPGDYTVVATYMGDDKFNTNITSEQFTVKGHVKVDTPIKADAYVNGYRVTIDVNVDANATGFVKVKIGDSIFNVELVNGEGSFINTFAAGSYTADLTYLGDDNFNQNSTIVTFTVVDVAKENTTISMDLGIDENNVTFTVNVNPNATGLVKLEVTGPEYYVLYVDVVNGVGYLYDILVPGDYTVVATYLGDSRYNTNVTSQDFTVKAPKPEANITVDVPSDIKAGEDTPITVDAPGATGNVTVIVDGVATEVPIVDGKANYTIPGLDVGEHTVEVVYNGDETHAPSKLTKAISVGPKASEFTEIVISGDAVITVKLVDGTGAPIANADLTYTINGKAFTAKTDDKGIVSINASSNSVVELKYAGSDLISPVNTTITIKDLAPVRASTVIVGNNYTQSAIEYRAGERGQNFTVQLVDANGVPLANKTVYIGYNGKSLERTTDENGFARVQINLQDANRLTFAVAFLGDEDYNATLSVYLITITKKPVTISAAAKTYKASAKTKKYTVTLKTIKGASADGKTYFAAGKKVTMKINGKTYTAKTNAKGQATFSLKIIKKGKFSASIKYAGDNTYESASKSVKITIK